jgi:hypothetical protein
MLNDLVFDRSPGPVRNNAARSCGIKCELGLKLEVEELAEGGIAVAWGVLSGFERYAPRSRNLCLMTRAGSSGVFFCAATFGLIGFQHRREAW